MEYRRFGRTGLRVSAISLGTVELGMDYGIRSGAERLRPDESDAAALLHFALDSGINLIDTARAYGASEGIIGRALRQRRGEYILVSKVKPCPGRPAQVRSQVEQSLCELQTSWLDVMMLHCGNEPEPDAESAGVLAEMRDAGRLRFVGASVYGPAAALAAIRSGRFDCIEIAYSVLDRRPEAEVLAAAREHDVGVIARSVLLKGALTERCRLLPAALEPVKRSVAKLAVIAGMNAGSSASLPEFAYRYVLGSEPPHSALVGTASRAELEECLQFAAHGPLAPEQILAAQSVRVDDERWLNPGNWPEPE